MPKLPQVSGAKAIKLLQSLGYTRLRQKGNHVTLRKVTSLGEHNITVPMDKVVTKGTLNDIMTEVGLWNNITKEELLKRLR
ncbi:MAG: addiction module toxin, HicA family [Chloroflexi bacterium]|nr:addiction module toxin, HicA family [Chloroflexota bacterium]